MPCSIFPLYFSWQLTSVPLKNFGSLLPTGSYPLPQVFCFLLWVPLGGRKTPMSLCLFTLCLLLLDGHRGNDSSPPCSFSGYHSAGCSCTWEGHEGSHRFMATSSLYTSFSACESVGPRKAVPQLGLMMHACDPNTQEAEVGTVRVQG